MPNLYRGVSSQPINGVRGGTVPVADICSAPIAAFMSKPHIITNDDCLLHTIPHKKIYPRAYFFTVSKITPILTGDNSNTMHVLDFMNPISSAETGSGESVFLSIEEIPSADAEEFHKRMGVGIVDDSSESPPLWRLPFGRLKGIVFLYETEGYIALVSEDEEVVSLHQRNITHSHDSHGLLGTFLEAYHNTFKENIPIEQFVMGLDLQSI